MEITSFCSKYQLHESKRLATLASFMNYIYQFQIQTTLVPTWNQCKHIPRPVGSDKYLVFNQRQLWSHSAHAHKLQDCSHIPMRGDIIYSVSANNRWIINVSFFLWLCQPMRKVLGLQVVKDTKYLSVRTRCVSLNSLLPRIDFSYLGCHKTYFWVGGG